MTKQTKKQLLRNAQNALQLELIYLHQAESSLNGDTTPYDLSESSINIGLDFSVGSYIEKEEKKKKLIVYPCKNLAEFKDTGTDEVMFAIKTEFRAVYSIQSDDLEDEALAVFGKENVMYHTYPYFREYLQNLLLRMGLPTFTMPMLLSRSEK